MNNTPQNLLRAIHEGKWLSIEYKNKQDEITKYWIAVYGIHAVRRSLKVEGFHLSEHPVKNLIQSISIPSGPSLWWRAPTMRAIRS